jgi:hypothetical protein
MICTCNGSSVTGGVHSHTTVTLRAIPQRSQVAT